MTRRYARNGKRNFFPNQEIYLPFDKLRPRRDSICVCKQTRVFSCARSAGVTYCDTIARTLFALAQCMDAPSEPLHCALQAVSARLNEGELPVLRVISRKSCTVQNGDLQSLSQARHH